MIKKKYILIEPITLHQLVDDREQKKNRFDRERGTFFFLPSIKLSSTLLLVKSYLLYHHHAKSLVKLFLQNGAVYPQYFLIKIKINKN